MKAQLNQIALVDKITLTDEDKKALTNGGLNTAKALLAAKKKGETLKTTLQEITTRLLIGAGLLAEEFIATKENPLPFIADSELFKAIRTRLASPAAVYACPNSELTSQQKATVKALQRAFDSMPWIQPKKDTLSEAQKAALIKALAEVAYMQELSLELIMTFKLSKEEIESAIGDIRAEDEDKGIE
jgi:hypothetical protein